MAPPPLLSPRETDGRQRVLLLHNRYRQAGGEERVVDELEALLRARGHAVARLERDSDSISPVRAARGLLREWLAGQHAPFIPAVVRVDDGGLLVGYRAPTPAGLLPG